MTQAAIKTAQALAYVTLKATGLAYILYAMASRTSDATYAVWTIDGKPTYCTCKDRKYRPWKMCDHMKEWQQQQAPTHETEGKLPQETRQALANWHQSQAGDAMERECEETRRSYMKMMESEW